MAKFNDNLRRIQTERRVSNKALAKAVGATPSMISKWRRNVVPEGERIVAIAGALGVSAELLTGRARSEPLRHGGTRVLDEGEEIDISHGYVKDDIPVVGEAEASANGLIIWDDQEIGSGIVKAQVTRWVSRSFADGDPKAYGLVVRNDSMVPRYFPGEVIVAQPRLEVRDGHYAVVYIRGGERLVKRVFKTNDGWILHSENTTFPDRTVKSDDVLAMHRIKHSIARM